MSDDKRLTETRTTANCAEKRRKRRHSNNNSDDLNQCMKCSLLAWVPTERSSAQRVKLPLQGVQPLVRIAPVLQQGCPQASKWCESSGDETWSYPLEHLTTQLVRLCVFLKSTSLPEPKRLSQEQNKCGYSDDRHCTHILDLTRLWIVFWSVIATLT